MYSKEEVRRRKAAAKKAAKKAAKPKDANPNLGKGPKAAKIWKPEIPQMLSQ